MKTEQKKLARGLVIGNFCPLHRGRMLVIDPALSVYDEVIVPSYTKPDFNGCGRAVRQGWLHTLYRQVGTLVLADGDPVELSNNDAPEA